MDIPDQALQMEQKHWHSKNIFKEQPFKSDIDDP